MNHSMYRADRATHIKIMIVGVLCAVLVVGIGTFARLGDGGDLGAAPLVKASQSMVLTGSLPVIR